MVNTMKNFKATILFMSGGSLVGQNILSCLETRRQNLRLIATNSVAEEPTLFAYDAVYLTPPTAGGSAAFIERFKNIVTKEKPEFIIPCRDEDVLILARAKQQLLLNETASCLCGNVKIAQYLLDKQKIFLFSLKYDLPFVPTIPAYAPTNEILAFAINYGYPLLIKPIEGFASQNIFLISNEKQLLTATRNKNLLVQQYLGDPKKILRYTSAMVEQGLPLFHSFEGLKHSIQLFISTIGVVNKPYVTCHKMVFGKSEQVWKITDPVLEKIGTRCGKVFAHEGWRGPLNIQCERTPKGIDMIYEFNGRFTGATEARYLLGHDEVGIAFKDFASIQLPQPLISSNNHKVIRVPRGQVIELDKVEQLKKHGYLGARI
jgi:hypothetical protein